MTGRTSPTVSPAETNGEITVRSTGPFGWFLALTSGLPRRGTLRSHLELRTGPNGERWTRHLRAGRAITSIEWRDRPNDVVRLTERLGPTRLHFRTTVDGASTQLALVKVTVGPLRLPTWVIDVTADATTRNDVVTTVVRMQLGRGKLGSLDYTSTLTVEPDSGG